MRYILFVFLLLQLVACENNTYPNYKIMKKESLWMLASCKAVVGEPSYGYKGRSAYILQTCQKDPNPEEWREKLSADLKQNGWRLVHDNGLRSYCFQNTAIVLRINEYSNDLQHTRFSFLYPSGTCRD
jgi:hypothetical protein